MIPGSFQYSLAQQLVFSVENLLRISVCFKVTTPGAGRTSILNAIQIKVQSDEHYCPDTGKNLHSGNQ